MGRIEPVTVGPARPVLVFDGACGFCRRWIARWQARAGDRIEFVPFQEPMIVARFPEIPRHRFEQAVVLIEPAGRAWAGAGAVLRALAWAPGWRWPWWAYQRLPGIARLTEAAYRFVASHRGCWPP